MELLSLAYGELYFRITCTAVDALLAALDACLTGRKTDIQLLNSYTQAEPDIGVLRYLRDVSLAGEVAR